MPAFTITATPGASTVACLADAVAPTTNLPLVKVPSCPTRRSSDLASPDVACEGTKTYTFTYTDCANNTATWTYTYTIDMPAFTITATPGASTVACLADAVAPTTNLPVVKDACGNTLTPVVTASPDV